jgi:hypothetical protein
VLRIGGPRLASRRLGEPARTRILTALLGGCAFTGKELAYFGVATAGARPAAMSTRRLG